MFFLGVLGVVQASLLPGLIVSRFFRISRIDRSVLVFPISLLSNYFIVFALTALGIYSFSSLSILIGLELILIYLFYGPLASRWFSLLTLDPEPNLATPEFSLSPLLKKIVFGFAFLTTAWLLHLLERRTPSAFFMYDDICNWNRWAVDWFNGRFPFHTWEYPQILPINWSLTYQMIGTVDIDYFATAINGLFPVIGVWSFWALYWQTREDLYLVAVPVFILFLDFVFYDWLGSGMADIPMAFFGSMMIYVAARGFNRRFTSRGTLILSTLIFSGACLTKQAGNFGLLFFVATLLMIFKRNQVTGRTRFKYLAWAFFLMIALVWSWYIHQKIKFNHGKEVSITYHVMEQIHGDQTYWQRFLHAHRDFWHVFLAARDSLFGPFHTLDPFWPQLIFFAVGGLSVLVFTICSLFNQNSPLALCAASFVAIPLYIFWAIFFSYGSNARNYGLGFAFLSLSIASGFIYFVKKIWPRWSWLKRPATRTAFKMGILAAVAAGLIHANSALTPKIILDYKIFQKMKNSTIFKGIYPRFEQGFFKSRVLTNYGCWKCDVFPGTHGLFFQEDWWDALSFEKDLFSGQFGYLLYAMPARPFFDEEIHKLEDEHRLHLIETKRGKDDAYHLYEIVPQVSLKTSKKHLHQN